MPADAVYARVDETRYNRLVEEAKEANFNMFRLWGGGIYEPDCFFEACLRNGILLWQDLMFSCASYPDHEEDFRNECQKEIEYQTKRLRRYSNLALLCGNNEITLHQSPLAQFHYDYSMDHRNTCGYHIFNNLAAEIAEKNCPHISYWNSSPYGGPMPNCSEIGDQHYWWPVCQKKGGNAMVEPTSYDRITSNFVSEYGCMGPLNKESMLAYDGGREPELNSPMFLHHTNSFENGMISSGIEQNYRSMKGISLDDYILCGQMMQSVLYQYSFEAMRYNDRCNGALLWMYHDVWGENGWSIVDYYIRRKASYYGVKRALAPARAIFRQESNEICLKLANDGPQPLLLQGSVGFLSYDGQRGEMKKTTFQAAPYSCEVVARWKTADLPEDGTLFFLPDGGKAEMAYWYRAPFRELSLPQPQLIVSQHVASDNTVLTVRSVTFAHGVHYIGDYLASDQYFDLAPGEEKTITVYRTGGKALEVGAMMPDGEQAAAYHADAV